MTPRAPASLPVSPDVPRTPPALDIEAGVERLMGNRAFYLRTLARFRTDYRQAALAIRYALDAGDGAQARRLVHTLKGAAGMIEARGLHAAALVLEAALRDGAGGIDTLVAQLDAALAGVLRHIDAMALMQEETPPAAPAQGDNLGRLRAMLDIGDGAAVELVLAARSELGTHLGKEGYEALNAAVAEFDYERALELLDGTNGTNGTNRPEQADRQETGNAA
jgi:HPt (histidine-containing phosphotransfer) domain-containing protein